MKLRPPFISTLLAGIVLLLTASGCMTVREQFDGYPRQHVWSAMTAVAQSPIYDDWHIITNEVWQSPDEARLEIYREVHRSVREPGRKPRVERRDWRFRIELLDTEPPMARLVSRGWSIPAYARREADRYFADVWQMLGPRPVSKERPDSQPDRDDSAIEPENDAENRSQIIDVDDLAESDP